MQLYRPADAETLGTTPPVPAPVYTTSHWRSINEGRETSNATFGSFDDFFSLPEEPLRPIVTALKEIILEVNGDACDVVGLGDRAATYGVGPLKMIDGYSYVLPYKNWVNLGFYQGVELADPEGLLKGWGRR